jgi:hypothetical protein
VIHRALVLTAYICCGLVIASFALFARDQMAGASKQQQTELVAGSDTPSNPHAVPVVHHHAQPRRFIDGAASTLTAPFRSFMHSDSAWSQELEGTLLALIVYGVGLGFLARYVRPTA